MIHRRDLLQVGAVGVVMLAASPLRAAGTLEQTALGSRQAFIERAFTMRQVALDNGDQGYGAVVVRDGEIVGQAPSRVVTTEDPTAHAEMEAIRDAARQLGRRNLDQCILYSSSRPCPMCEAAAYWAGIEQMVFGRDVQDGGRPSLC